ncbi:MULTISPECIES: beta-propeller fold lactonase family protein [Nocardia]|uniref:beta-propeller fold lactonase family protein n=1 Tax=Nocardia TaxID=1817 RepID=UPI000D6879D1|nr:MULTISPECIES: beta-propeller fold lactonase family protein [Nocardia]
MANAAKAYVTNTDSDDISVVDVKSRKELKRVSVGGSPRGAVRFDREKNFGYVSNCAGNTVSVVDLNRDREVAKITVGIAPRGMTLSPDGRHAYVSNSGDNTLSIVDLTERREIRRIAMGANPRHMAVIPKANRLLVAQWGSDAIGNLDLTTGLTSLSALSAIPVGSGARPYSLTPNSDGTVAYVANTQADYISVVDISNSSEKKRIQVGYGSRAIAFSSDEKFAFVSIENANEIVVIDTVKNAVATRVSVGPSPRGVALSVASHELFSSNFSRGNSGFGDAARNSLTVVDVKDPRKAKVVAHIKVGLGPCSVSILE